VMRASRATLQSCMSACLLSCCASDMPVREKLSGKALQIAFSCLLICNLPVVHLRMGCLAAAAGRGALEGEEYAWKDAWKMRGRGGKGKLHSGLGDAGLLQ
jgi:hypothetical protein